MALLTAEDVLNKAFSKTKYREGFDQDEVDDFLDEVANTIAALTAERDELQQRLAQAGAGGVAAPAVGAANAQQTAGVDQGTASGSLLQAATDPNPPSATTMLAMAQKLHDEYVQAGEEARDRLIDEAKSKAETIVEQAEKDARGRMQDLDSERADIERRIDDLRRFERDYRGHLRNYLENLLGDLEHNASKASAGPVGSSTSDQSPSAEPDEQESAPSASETSPEVDSAPNESAFPSAWGAPAPSDEDAPAPSEQGAPAAPQSPLGSFSDEDFGFDSGPEPQVDHNPFAMSDTADADPESPASAGQPGFPSQPSNDDESGDNPTDAPRWNF